MERDSSTFAPWVLAGHTNPGEYVLLRVRNRLIDLWDATETIGPDCVDVLRAIALVDFCLSQLRRTRVNL